MAQSAVTRRHLSPRELLSLDSLRDRRPPQYPLIVTVPVDDDWPESSQTPVWRAGATLVIGVTRKPSAHPRDHRGAPSCDVVVAEDDDRIEAIVDTMTRLPVAASVFVDLLRGSEQRNMTDGLLLESAAYSMLQGSPEFTRWCSSRQQRSAQVQGTAPVKIHREHGCLVITLNRPHVRNALNTAMRDALLEAFDLVALDDSIEMVILRGEGGSFCSGGDLDEFGSFVDPASAHLVRLEASVGRAIARVTERVTVELEGACVGSGIELPCFATHRVASPTATFALPELGLGLIPGAGGTWSLPQRIGRHRTALVGLTGEIIDAATAFQWDLVTRLTDN